jgi:hypothetical protein
MIVVGAYAEWRVDTGGWARGSWRGNDCPCLTEGCALERDAMLEVGLYFGGILRQVERNLGRGEAWKRMFARR